MNDNFMVEDDEGVKTTVVATSKIEAIKVLYGFNFVKFAGYHDYNSESTYYKVDGRWFLITRLDKSHSISKKVGAFL